MEGFFLFLLAKIKTFVLKRIQTNVLFKKGVRMMKEQLIKAMHRNRLVDMMYLSKRGEVTQRRVKIIKMVGDSFQSLC